MPPEPLPHVYPFRFVDAVLEERDETFSRGRVAMQVTADQRACSGDAWSSPFLLAEAIAQSALLLQGGDAEIGRTGFLAAVNDFVVSRPPRPGDALSIDVALSGSYGRFRRFSGIVRDASREELARGEILVREGDLRA
jgi:3-hydroxymyristoyl/3-hydroxydecanoyl-(acyl carrier protein) dehydratase